MRAKPGASTQARSKIGWDRGETKPSIWLGTPSLRSWLRDGHQAWIQGIRTSKHSWAKSALSSVPSGCSGQWETSRNCGAVQPSHCSQLEPKGRCELWLGTEDKARCCNRTNASQTKGAVDQISLSLFTHKLPRICAKCRIAWPPPLQQPRPLWEASGSLAFARGRHKLGTQLLFHSVLHLWNLRGGGTRPDQLARTHASCLQ